jgi:hypothetical protein
MALSRQLLGHILLNFLAADLHYIDFIIVGAERRVERDISFTKRPDLEQKNASTTVNPSRKLLFYLDGPYTFKV